jgi:putative inorganic carbon (hco3(-)) transporter
MMTKTKETNHSAIQAGFPEDLYRLRPSAIWRAFSTQTFAFWMSCAYLFFEYVRPQAIWSVFEVYPYWARTFLMLALIGWILDPKRQLVWNRITTGIFVLLGLVLISSYLAYWPEISRYHLVEFLNWVVVFFVLTQTVTTRTRFFLLLLIFLAASFKLSFYGARTWALMGFQFSDWGLRGPAGYFENPGELAVQMVVFAPIALHFCFAVSPYITRWQRYVLYLMPLTAALTTLGTNTRGGQLALATQVVALILTMKHRFKALALVTILAVIGFQLLPEEQRLRFQAAGEDSTSEQRLLYWKNGWQMMKDHPFTGVGYFNFIPYYTQHHQDDLLYGSQAELPHNIFIQIGTDTGFTGLAVFVAVILSAYGATRRLRRDAMVRNDNFVGQLATGLNLSLLGFLVAGQFVTIAYYPYLWIHLAFVTMMMTFVANEGSPRGLQRFRRYGARAMHLT